MEALAGTGTAAALSAKEVLLLIMLMVIPIYVDSALLLAC